MEKIATENLFLLEFLVDKVDLDPNMTREVSEMMGSTCVTVQFLDNAPLNICEDDFVPARNYNKEPDSLKSGKSCLFSLTPQQVKDAVTVFDVYLTVYKKMAQGVLPEKVDIGVSLVSVKNLFNELIESISTTPGTSPSSKTLKDNFDLTNSSGQPIGQVSLYIRMSCFGKLIVTQFQMNLDDKSVLFKDKDGRSLYRYKKARKEGELGMNGDMGGMGGACPGSPCPPRGGYGGRGGGGMSSTPCNECRSLVPNTANAASSCMNPMTSPADGAFEEIGAQMGGNALTIRVHKDRHRVEQGGDEGFGGSDFCSCTGGGGGRSGYGGGGGTHSNTNPIIMRGNQFDPFTADQPFSFKMSGCGQGASENVTVVPPVGISPDGTQYTEISDPNREVFILRIGKKITGANKKNNLELELCTPKAPPKKPRPRKETRDTQWDDADAPGGGGKGGKGGKGGGKGKGKGKGKGSRDDGGSDSGSGGGHGGGGSDDGSDGEGGGSKGGKGGKGDGKGGKGKGGVNLVMPKPIVCPFKPCSKPCLPCNPCNPCPPCMPCNPCNPCANVCCYRYFPCNPYCCN